MGDHTRPSASRRSPSLSSDDDNLDFSNEPTNANNTAGSGSPWVPSQTTIDILQAHLAVDPDSDASEASEPRVHPDFFVYLERLRRLNETTRVNARREVEAWHQAMFGSNQSQNQASQTVDSQHQHHASLILNESHDEDSPMIDEPQDEAARILDESYQGTSQFTNEFNQPLYHAGAEHGLQPPAMGMREQHGTQDPTTAESSGPIPHVRFETPDPMGTAARDHSRHHRAPSPYPTATQGESSAASNSMPPPPIPAREPRRYTDWGNPYRFPFDPAPFPEGATPYAPERIMQAWLIRQQLIAGVRPEDIEPMAIPRGRRHRTPPYMILNETGAHIVRIEPAAFEGTMLPLPVLPWLPRRPNPNSSTAPVLSNTPDASGLPTGLDTATAPNSASILNSSVAPNPATNQPVASDLSAAATPLAALNPPDPPAFMADSSPVNTLNSSVASNSSAATNPSAPQPPPVDTSSASPPNLSATPNMLATTNLPVTSHLPAAPALTDSTVVSDPTYLPEQSSRDLSQDVAESQNPDPRMVAFFQPLRLHQPANSASASVPDSSPERPTTSEPSPNENSQISAAALQAQSQATMPLSVQNRTDADSISSQEVHGVGVSPAHSQDRDSSTVSPLSNEGTETGHVPPPHAPNGNGVMHHAITLSEPEDPDEPATPRLRRFAIDGADDTLVVSHLSGEVKAASDQSSFRGLI
ncbi:hypothetical protein PCG10_008298 [Penicillium crustosum]|uniref:Uncharacterized protein n=1 Tax=Penicillium crustosum TaxID=36656 RepID=A0A9P5GIY4_PENCR|nr:uncharacterized protein N7487_000235 [Penicillium crustosum]KAF7521519.1 hypothetical protein PCG10_008298 [Penicillium crustosum]KAJ5416685.1 hypothetical protein N7487_000235 [Penicillium crustosum]